MVSLPGAYPLDDSAPATPEEPATQNQSQRQQQHSLRDSLIAHHHDQNRLRKPQDPRSHQQSDLGAAGTGLSEAQSSKTREHPSNDFLDATGGDYYTYEPVKPSSAVESQPVRNTAPQDTTQSYTQQGTHHNTHDDTFRDIQQDIQRDVREPARETRHTEQPAILQTDQTSFSQSDNDAGKQSGSADSPPYWGNLPKGQRGGIYNTVTGHGSPKDDHDQHHHIQERSPRSERSHIPGPVRHDKTTTRVYNTVAGHGSQDEESKRHNAPPSRSESAPIASTEAVHDAPLVGIPEEKQFQSGLSSTKIPSSDLGLGILPETAAQDDAKLLSRYEDHVRSEEKDRSRGVPSVAWATEMSGPKSNETSQPTTGPKSDTMHRRAFPLGPLDMLSGEDADRSRSSAARDAGLGAGAHDAIKENETSKPPSDNHRGAMLAGAGVVGTGIAASELADRHESKKDSPRSFSEDRHSRKRLSKLDKKNKDSPSSGSEYSSGKERQSLEGRKSRSKSRGREESSPKTEKMSHKILGLFGLNKDDKETKQPQETTTTEPAKEAHRHHSPHEHHGVIIGKSKNDKRPQDTSATEPSKDSSARQASPDHSSHHGIFARNKNDKQLPDTSTTEPPKESPKSPKEQSPRRSGDKKKEAALGAAAGAGAMGLLHKHKDDDKSKHHRDAREPTNDYSQQQQQQRDMMHSHDDKGKSPFKSDPARAAYGVQVAEKGSEPGTGAMAHPVQGPVGPQQQPAGPTGQSEVPNFSQPIHSDRSKAAPMAAAGLGAAAGAGAYAAHRRDDKPQAPPSSSSATGYGVANPRAAPQHSASQHQAQVGDMGSAARSAAIQSHKQPAVTNQPGNYNTLSSGTASGVATDNIPHHMKSQSYKMGSSGPVTQQPGDYNMLHSGTASGVKSHQQPEGTTTQKPGDYNNLRSGTASGVATAAAVGAGAGAQKKESQRRGSTGTYNHLASGTPSGVVVEPRRHRASEDHGRSGPNTGSSFKDQPPLPFHSRAGNTQQQSSSTYQMPPPPISKSAEQQDVSKGHDDKPHKGFVSVPITSRSPRRHDHPSSIPKPEKKSSISETDNADRIRHMSPEVMPSAYTTSSPARTGQGSNDSASAAQAKHMSPEVMPSAYTTSSAPRSGPEMSQSQDQAPVRSHSAHPHPSDLDPSQAALAAATGAWASSAGAPGGPASMYGAPQHNTAGRNSAGSGTRKLLHTCEHCGRENDITAYLASQQSI